MNLLGHYAPSWSILVKTILPDHHFHLGCECFTELFLSNIMKYGKNDIE